MKKIKAIIVCKNPEGGEESKLNTILKHEDFDFIYSWKNTLSQKDLKDIDLVIAIGGDGTILSASHFLLDKPLLAINSDPQKSVGALATITLEELPNKLEEIKLEKSKHDRLERIEVSINDCPISHLVLNEVFIGNEKPFHLSKYELSIKGKKETQRSSGLIFSTGTGSTAWFQSAGGKPFQKDSKFIKMIVREPYQGKDTQYTMTNCEIQETEEIKITLLGHAILAVDSIREYKLNPQDIVKLKISSHPLKRII